MAVAERTSQRWAMRITALIGGPLVILILAELGARWVGPPASSYHIFAPAEGLYYRGAGPCQYTLTGQGEEFSHQVTHNREGFRDRDHPLPKPAGFFRILCLGDSFTYGVGTEDDQTYPALLEQLLNARGEGHRKVEVINAGLPGYSTIPERMMLAFMGPRYNPDLVLAGILANDVVETAVGIEKFQFTSDGYLVWRVDDFLGPGGNYLYLRSRLLQAMLKGYVKKRQKDEFRARHPDGWDGVYEEGSSFEGTWEIVESEFLHMRGIAEGLGARLVILYIPQQDFDDPKHEGMESRLKRFCDKESLPFISALPDIRRAVKETRLYYPKDGHARPEGYRVLAEAVGRALVEQGLIQ
jgi:lysophospholipase L1-like esterase